MANSNSGGKAAVRGFLVQAVVALLDTVRAEPPFIHITLEPTTGNDQFDYIWTSVNGTHATQVKSTINTFSRTDVEHWVDKLQKARKNESCRLVLVGNVPSSLDGIDLIGDVAIEKKTMNGKDLIDQASNGIARFLEANHKPPGNTDERDRAVHAIIAKLEHLSAESKSFSHEEFVALLSRWIGTLSAQSSDLDSAEAEAALRRRIRDFKEIVGRAIDEFNIENKALHEAIPGNKKVKFMPIDLECLKQMRIGGLPDNPENLNRLGEELWDLVLDGRNWENFHVFWANLFDGLLLRFPRAISVEDWKVLQVTVVKNHSQFDKPRWGAFLKSLVRSPYLAPAGHASALSLEPYRQYIAEKFREITLSGFGGPAAQSDVEGKADLSSIYIDLDTKADRESRTRVLGTASKHSASDTIPALRWLAVNPHLVLIGLPGSGKSTLLKYFSFCLAKSGLDPESEWRARLDFWPREELDLIPVFVELRHFAASLHALHRPFPKTGRGSELADFILRQLKAAGLEECKEPLKAALRGGKAIVFLDGLDEVPDADNDVRRFVLDAVKEFSHDLPTTNRVVVTCRPRSYEDRAWRLDRFPHAELASLSRDKIHNFIDRFYMEVERRDHEVKSVTKGRTDTLKSALQRPELRELATNPFMLTVMAWLHRSEELPRKRALILHALIEQLLHKWEVRKQRDDPIHTETLPELLREHGLDISSFRRVLSRLAFESRDSKLSPSSIQGSASGVSIPRSRLMTELENLLPQDKITSTNREAWALNIIQFIDRRTGLLIPEGTDSFTMPYKLQEFLAGEHLTNNDELEELGPRFGLKPEESHFHTVAAQLIDETGYWDEVVKWSGGIQAHVRSSDNTPRELAVQLCESDHEPKAVQLRRALIAHEILIEVGLAKLVSNHKRLGLECIKVVSERLEEFIPFDKEISIRDHAAAASARGWMDELPHGVGLDLKKVPNIAWVKFSAGEYKLAAQSGRVEPDRVIKIQHPYCISRYPVTVAQFQAFVDDGGYTTAEYWNWQGASEQWIQEAKDGTGPANYENVYQTPNHPRVGVNWFEAMAFCKWLNKKLALPANSIHLPSSEEWLNAAKDIFGLWWAMDDDDSSFTPDRCNIALSNIDHTSPVGLFPKGDTPKGTGNEYGVADMAGNVWEWCRTSIRSGATSYWARGGSWNTGQYSRHVSPLVRAFNASDRFNDLGFRLVLFESER
jgi:formylglycine-generating enzyme required for sulfatase activity